MTVVGTVVLYPMPVARAVAGATAVATSALSGLEIGGSLAGMLSGLAAVAALAVSVAATNRKNKRDYDREIQDAEDRGAREAADRLNPMLSQAQRDAEFWRNAYVNGRSMQALPPLEPPADNP